jgi:hypothetical protein
MMYDRCMTNTSTLRRVTVNLTERSSNALDLAIDLKHDTLTDTVNRALQVYAYLVTRLDKDDQLYILDHVTGETDKILFL